MMKYILITGLVILGFISIRSGTAVSAGSAADEKCKECHTDVTGYANIHPAMENGCTICHEPQGDDHPEKGGFKLVDNVPGLCFICHEEYHKKSVHAPASEGDCLSCHSPHGSNNEALLTEKKEELCIMCHDLGSGENYKPHFSDFNASCTDCHDAHQSDNSSLLKQPVPAVCFECHEDESKAGEDLNVHYPYSEESCTACHKPHGSETPGMLTEKMPELCFVCHEEFDRKNIHSPVSEGDCMSCHSPHTSANGSLLTEPEGSICMVCHELETGDDFKPHFSDFSSACSECHDPHQSDNSSLLKQAMPNLCFQCHEDESEGGEAASIHYPYSEESCTMCHKPHGSESEGMLTEKMPDICFMCHDKGEYSDPHEPYRKGKCAECHSPHASDEQSLLKMNSKDLCLQCHNRTYRTDSTFTRNIGQEMAKNEFIHGAIEMDGCASCHAGHGSQNSDLLRRKYPDSFYAEGTEENFALCFECHDAAILEKDPSASGTGFRNGNTNLHYVHLHGTKGRSCSLCHDVHAAKNIHLIKEKVPFGDWSMDMNYKMTGNGGSCMPGCHAEYKYER